MIQKKKRPEISVIVPVLNEAGRIDDFLAMVRRSAGEAPVEIVVVDGDGLGSTLEMIRDDDIVKMLSPKSRGTQMNRGALAAAGDILLFLHADTVLPIAAFENIRKALEDMRIVGGAFDLGIDSPRYSFRLIARCASLKHRLTRVPYGDQAIFIRADYFRHIGGYREIPLFEDVELMKRIKRLRGKIAILRDRTKTSPRKWEKDGVVYTVLRNWSLQVLFLLGVEPGVLVRHYYGE